MEIGSDKSKRRLDRRAFNSQAYEMALLSPRMTIVAYAYRPILTSIQCGVILLTLGVMAYKYGLHSSTMLLLAIFTGCYGSIYLLRLLPFGSALERRPWWIAQLATGFLEIVVLGVLDALYSSLEFGHGYFWWALYILPVYRLAEVSGFAGWLGGLGLSSVLLLVEPLVCPSCYEIPDLYCNIPARAALLALSTFMLFYVLHLLDLSHQAARFWHPVASPYMSGAHDAPAGSRLLKTVFNRGLDSLLRADWGALWQLELCEGSPVLRLVYEYRREQTSWPFLDRWTYQRKPGVTSEREEVMPAETVLNEQARMAADQVFIAHSEKANCTDHLPWKLCKEKDIRSWLVVPISPERTSRPTGYLEVGFRWRFGRLEWPNAENRASEVGKALAEVFERIRQIEASMLRDALLGFERKAENETDLYGMAVEALSDHFHRRVLIVEYSFVDQKIVAVFGSWEPTKVDWLASILHTQQSELNRPGVISECRVDEQASRECLFICPLTPQRESVDVVVLVDNFEILAATDQQALRDSVGVLNAIRARMRAAEMMEQGSEARLDMRPAREKLNQVAQSIQKQTGADVIVLYVFEAGRPKIPPIIVGKLENERYLEKPIVIEDSNPVLCIAQAKTPQFFEDVQLEPMGSGKNRHGDDVFAVREGIRSSVGLPLRTHRGVIGVVWVNFRKQQRFDPMTHDNYMELSRQLPLLLEGVQVSAAAQSLAVESTRQKLRAELHDHLLQDVIGAGAYLSTAANKVRSGQAKRALEDIATAAEALCDAEKKTRNILDGLEEISQDTDEVRQLEHFAQQLQNEYGFPAELSMDGLNEIPPHLYGHLLPVIEEAMRNAAKHGEAKRIAVQVSDIDGLLQLIIRDNGRGFDPSPEEYGHGIRSMCSRVDWLGGKISIASRKGEGTVVVIEILTSRKEGSDIWNPSGC